MSVMVINDVHNRYVSVLAPDQASGEDFLATLKKFETNEIKYELYKAQIAPRVVGNKINKDKKVVDDLVREIDKLSKMNYEVILIACNTLQLWKEVAFSIRPDLDDKTCVITTFDAVANCFEKNEDVVWLGTSVLSKSQLIRDKKFKTMEMVYRKESQDLVQEIIWRTKAVYGSDISTANKFERFNSEDVLKSKFLKLIEIIEDSDNTFVLGCTEIPILFKKYSQFIPKNLKTVDPAWCMGKYIQRMLGGN